LPFWQAIEGTGTKKTRNLQRLWQPLGWHILRCGVGMAIHHVVKRSFVCVPLMLLASSAYFQARGITQLLGSALGHGPTPRAAGKARGQASSTTERKTGGAILERNLFDSVTGPLLDPSPSQPSRATRSTSKVLDPLASPTCQDVQVLIVTESSDPWWSLATLREPGEPRARLRRVGDGVAGKQVAFIGYNPRQQAPSVWIEGGGTLCQAQLFRPAVVVVPAALASPAATPEDATRIRRLEEPRSPFGVRFVPTRQDGRLVGLRVFGIRPGSLLSSLGLQNGDRLESINGLEIASPQKALEAYARLSTATRLSVRIVRLGRPVQIDLNII